ncbi:MAG: desulfoferrodoxin [Sedimentisphaerales bacterium]|nr:desulfoferrodoxin [Sedimentisphaerales bacterium]
MANRLELYKCDKCGNVIEMIWGDYRHMLCCGTMMHPVEAKTADAKTEKHVPVIEKVPGGFKVTVGSVPHPMEENHYIQWIEIQADGKVYTEYLKPGMAPEATFTIDAEKVTAREYCNVHGLWKGEM